MTTTPPGDHLALHIRSRAELIAAIPTLIGFTPTDSAVLIGTHQHAITTLARIDLTDIDDHAADLARHRLLGPADTAELIIIAEHHDQTDDRADPAAEQVTSPGSKQAGASLPYTRQATLLTTALAGGGYQVTHAAWIPALQAGQVMHCYHHNRCGEFLPDPRSTPLAAAAAVAGRVTHPSRHALAQTLRPDPAHLLGPRAALITTLAARAADRAANIRLIRTAVARAHAGHLPTADADIAELALALTDPAVRDTSLTYSLDHRTRAAQRLWTTLLRATPAPYRAEPAVLLAVTAYLHGDGVLAALAADAALHAHPRHRLATLIHLSLRAGLPAEQLRAAVTEAAGTR